MNIRLKTLGINTLAVASVLFVLYQVSSPIILRGFEKVEKADAVQNVGRVTDALNGQLSSQSAKLRDWSSWDDSYYFAADGNKDFIDSNFGDNPNFKSPIFDMLLYYNPAGKLMYNNGAETPPKELLDQIKLGNPLLKYGNVPIEDADKSAVNGVIVLKDSLVLISSRPILQSTDEGPTNGTLIFVKVLTKEYKQELADITHIDLGIYSVDDKNMPADAQAIMSSLRGNDVITKIKNSSTINGYTLFNDVYSQPSILVRINLDRNIYLQGKESLRLFLRILLIAGILFPIVTFILLEALVVRRIEILTKDVTNIKDQSSLKNKLNFKGRDEVALLATSINHMLERIERSNVQVHNLVDQLKVEKDGIEDQVKQRTHQLQEEKTRFLASIHSLPLGFILTDSTNRILMMNPSIKKILKFTADDTTSIAKQIVEKDSLLQKMMEHAHKVATEKKIATTDLTSSEGRFLHALAAPILTKDGGVDGTVILVEDITEAKILERSREEFFSIASHELRTPLTAIRGNTSLMKQMYEDELKDPSLGEMVDDIHTSSMRLIEIVNDFLDVSSLEQGKMKFIVEDFDILDVIEKVTQEMGGIVAEKKLYLNHNKPAEPLPAVHADSNRVKQVIYNLIGNAVKFTEEGGVTVNTELAYGNMLRITITDTGRGISPEGQQILFHKFQQTGKSLQTRDTTRGTGLGLYISKLIVEHFGGHIQLESSKEGEGHGSTFSLTLPLA